MTSSQDQQPDGTGGEHGTTGTDLAHAAPTTTGSHRSEVRPQPGPEAPRGPAVGTLVWGCVVLAVAGLLGAWELAGLRLDLSLVVPVGMLVLGVLLVVGAVATAVRSNRG